jgi:hypothetical protein
LVPVTEIPNKVPKIPLNSCTRDFETGSIWERVVEKSRDN